MTKGFLIAVCIIIAIALIIFPLLFLIKHKKIKKKELMFGEFLSIVFKSIKLR